MLSLLALYALTSLASPQLPPRAGEGAQRAPASTPIPLEYYLPADASYAAGFPRPESVLGWTVGEWHVRHDQLVAWFRAVAEASPRVTLETYGATHEARPLLLATVTSPRNHARLEQLRRDHVTAVLSGASSDPGPAVVWLGYGVHGNESSASNAALVVLYHLAAAQGAEMEAFLEDTIVVIDPCLNPDGGARFAEWANSHRGRVLVGDSAHREHNEAWPGGRTNHYWFDLNRDWLLLTHPESRARVAAFHRWMPCVLTDHHEMGTDSTFFFQPGIPSRVNPLTPPRNLELTRAIGNYHARALDQLGSLYFTEESYDDFYYGKGSTYPDIQGCIGILFEQASSRGHLQDNSFGSLSFPFTIRNQVTTSLSTLQAAHALRVELSAYQRESFRSALDEARASDVAAYVFGAAEDPGRTFELADILRRHGLEVRRLGRSLAANEETFEPGAAFIVPLAQPQARLVRAVFETRTAWDDNTFYDVSSWTLPLSFGLPYSALSAEALGADGLGAPWDGARLSHGSFESADGALAWAFDWSHASAPRALAQLLRAGVRARVATEPFEAVTAGGSVAFARGTVLVARSTQDVAPEVLAGALQDVAAAGLSVRALVSGLTGQGVDLGSSSLKPLTLPRPLLVVGSGVSSYEAGEAWFELDQRVGLPVCMVEREDLDGLDLTPYSHLLLVTGANQGWSDALTGRVKEWSRRGGVVVATRGAAVVAAGSYLSSQPVVKPPEPPAITGTYADYDDLRAGQRIAGTIFEVAVDTSHPLAFGIARPRLPVFRSFDSTLPHPLDPFSMPFRYTEAPLLSGFAPERAVQRIAGTPAVRAERLGAGVVVCIVDNPLFRGVWYGARRVHSNALFFAGAIQRTGPIESAENADESDESR